MCTLIVLAACVAAGGEPLPVPAGEELAKAEKTVQEVFGKDPAAAARSRPTGRPSLGK